MKFSDFINGTPVQRADLFGPWKQKKIHLDEDEPAALKAITDKLGWLRSRFVKYAKKIQIPENATVQFKRADVNGTGDGEWALISVDGKPFKCYTVSGEGFQEMPLDGYTAVVSVTKPKATTYASAESVPYELRTTWVNRAQMEKNNAECEKRAVDYWNKRYPGMY